MSLSHYLGEKRNKDKNKILVLIYGNVVTLAWIGYEYTTRILLLFYLDKLRVYYTNIAVVLLGVEENTLLVLIYICILHEYC
jgi:hypothetical protein